MVLALSALRMKDHLKAHDEHIKEHLELAAHFATTREHLLAAGQEVLGIAVVKRRDPGDPRPKTH